MPTRAHSPSAVRRRLPKHMTIDGLRDALAGLTLEDLKQIAASTPAVTATVDYPPETHPLARIATNQEEKTP
jgi:hypothetical protein